MDLTLLGVNPSNPSTVGYSYDERREHFVRETMRRLAAFASGSAAAARQHPALYRGLRRPHPAHEKGPTLGFMLEERINVWLDDSKSKGRRKRPRTESSVMLLPFDDAAVVAKLEIPYAVVMDDMNEHLLDIEAYEEADRQREAFAVLVNKLAFIVLLYAQLFAEDTAGL